jgi:hypothetical protein
MKPNALPTVVAEIQLLVLGAHFRQNLLVPCEGPVGDSVGRRVEKTACNLQVPLSLRLRSTLITVNRR